MKRQLIIIVGILFTLLAAGCSSVPLPSLPWSSSKVEANPTATALYKEGLDYFKRERYLRSIGIFEKVRADFPFSPEVTPAELKIAEAYYRNKQYAEATAAFKEFKSLHPKNENIPSVTYHLGMAQFKQITTVDRDQKVTELAKGYFETVVKKYPESPYAEKAKKNLLQCREYLAEHQFTVAAYYLKKKKYPAARDRLEEILRQYGSTPTAVKSLYYLGESYRLGKNNIKAALAYQALIEHFPEHALAKKAESQLGKLKQEKADPLAILLMHDDGAAYVPPPELAESTATKDPQKARKELNLVTKTEVVHEEPGIKKGRIRRVLDVINPFASGSDDGKVTEIDTAKESSGKEESKGFLSSVWSGLNPFASEEKSKAETKQGKRLITHVDKSLKEKGLQKEPTTELPAAPASDLSQVAKTEKENTWSKADTADLFKKLDVTLQETGKTPDTLPPTPEIAPQLEAGAVTKAKKPIAKETESAAAARASDVLTGIDAALKQKGVDLPELDGSPSPTPKKSESPHSAHEQATSTSTQKVKLDTKIHSDEGPLFLKSGEVQSQEQEKTKKTQEKKSAQSEGKPTKLPDAIVEGPPSAAPKTETVKKSGEPTELDDEENIENPFEAVEKQAESLRSLLNPLNPFGE